MLFGVDILVLIGLFALLGALFCVAYAVTIMLDGLQFPANSALAVMWIVIAGVLVMMALCCFGVISV